MKKRQFDKSAAALKKIGQIQRDRERKLRNRSENDDDYNGEEKAAFLCRCTKAADTKRRHVVNRTVLTIQSVRQLQY